MHDIDVYDLNELEKEKNDYFCIEIEIQPSVEVSDLFQALAPADNLFIVKSIQLLIEIHAGPGPETA